MAPTTVIRTYLEMRSPDALRAANAPDAGSSDGTIRVERREAVSPAEYRALYRAVGEAYHWRDRLAWSEEALAAYLAQPSVAVWVLTVGGVTAGYFELRAHDDGSIEIAYFGLVRQFIGRGLGKHLLTRAVQEAWRDGASRVWLHTCTLDDPAALPNYLARGFTPYRQETYTAAPPAP